jgi:hypothetical protein
MEEDRVLGEQLVHADHVQVLDAAGGKPVQAVQAHAPQYLREQQDTGEAEDVRQCLGDGDTAVGGDPGDEFRHDQRRDVVDADVAHRRQQHRGHREQPEPGELPSVVTKCEGHRTLVRLNLARSSRSHPHPVSSYGGPSPVRVRGPEPELGLSRAGAGGVQAFSRRSAPTHMCDAAPGCVMEPCRRFRAFSGYLCV